MPMMMWCLVFQFRNGEPSSPAMFSAVKGGKAFPSVYKTISSSEQQPTRRTIFVLDASDHVHFHEEL
jgi:hypothetical protein